MRVGVAVHRRRRHGVCGTALPVLIMLLDKLSILGAPIGQRVLRYASLDDIAIWVVLAAILVDMQRIGLQCAFLAASVCGSGYRS